jgi:SAM-dependent methyltransferase
VEKPNLEYRGRCPICETDVTFTATTEWLRGSLKCSSCESVPRERALAIVLEELHKEWRSLTIHESSPEERGISSKLKREADDLVRSQFYPDVPLGEMHKGFRNEDLQRLTFADNTFDLVITLDVFEHIPLPQMAMKEIWRTLKVGGAMLCTWPVRKGQVEPMKYRARLRADGTFEHLLPPEIHGNPVDPGGGALVTVDYGYDIHQLIEWTAPFDVRVYRFADRTHGVLGEYLEVFHCRKRISPLRPGAVVP